ncbi:uncharacterized protein LOC134350253 [Mobula hypostoma]|uniref:uncharacterized protein LOC134350253 n=1 Tax=Mobula hypostoma TaxID=723540 RepID=UPI002FC2CD4C
MNSQVTQDTLKTAEAHKTVIKIKRKKTRRELNRAKFGKAVVEKLFKCKAGRPFQDMPPAEKCHCQCVVSSWAAETSIAKPSPNPSWIITQGRLTHHLGIFNKEVKSINVERLLDGEQTKDCCPAITKESTTAKLAEEAMEVTSCTPVPKEAAVPVQQPHSLTPKLQPNVEDAHITLASPTQATESKSQCHHDVKECVVPTTELAEKLIKTLNTHQVFPGENLVHSMQQELLNILIERHGKEAGLWLPALSTKQESGASPPTGMSRPPRSGCSPLDESTIVNKSLSPKDQQIEDSFLIQNDGSVCGALSSTHSTVGSHLWCPKLDSSGFTGEKIFGISLSGVPGHSGFSPPKVPASLPGPQVGSSAGNQADEEHALSTSARQRLWLWRNAGSLQRTKAAPGIPQSPVVSRDFPFTKWELSPETADLGQTSAAQKRVRPSSASPPFSSRSPHQRMPKANSSLARILEAYRDTPGRGRWSPLSPNPGKGARAQGSWGCGLGTTGHGRSWKEEDEDTTFRSTGGRHPVRNKRPLPEGGHTTEMPPLPLHPHSLAKGRAWPQARAGQPSSPQWLGIPPWHPTQEPSPERALHASVLEPPPSPLCGRAVARAGPYHIREPSASGKGAQSHYGLIHGSWDGKGSSEGPLGDSRGRAYLNWNGTQACQLVSGDGLRCRVEPLPLSLCYPPSDCLEWSDLPLPTVLPKNDWGSSSPEPWLYPRMKLY